MNVTQVILLFGVPIIGVILLAASKTAEALARRRRIEANRARQQYLKPVRFTATPGAYTEQWCDGCNRTHSIATIYAYPDGDPTTATPVGKIIVDKRQRGDKEGRND